MMHIIENWVYPLRRVDMLRIGRGTTASYHRHCGMARLLQLPRNIGNHQLQWPPKERDREVT
jgi:hypothetical protein